jgi:hypothetical protein
VRVWSMLWVEFAMSRLQIISLLTFTGCSATTPAGVGPLVFPRGDSAITVSSARFFAVDPAAELNNSAMRNCRFGRTTKIPVVSSLVELSLTELKVSGQTLGSVSEGRLEASHRALLESRLGPMASVNRALAAQACHPWHSGPEDASMVPALLVAADARAPASSLELIIDVAWAAGFDEAALWVEAPGQPGAAAGAGAALTPGGGDVATVAREIDAVRRGGEPCVLFTPGSGAAVAAEASAAPRSGALRETIPVLPIAQTGDRRLVTGEVCGDPSARIAVEVVSEDAGGTP